MNKAYYVVVDADNLNTLRRKVNEYIDDGYIPKGGICVIKNESGNVFGYLYYQAMCKCE